MSDAGQGKRAVHFNDNARHLRIQVFGMQQIGKSGRSLHRADGMRAGRADTDFKNIENTDHGVFPYSLKRPSEDFRRPVVCKA